MSGLSAHGLEFFSRAALHYRVAVDPLRSVELHQTISVSPRASRVAIHLNDKQGVNRGSLGEAEITKLGTTSSMRIAVLIAVVFVVCLASRAGEDTPAAISTAIDVRPEDLLAQPPAGNWISYNGDYSGRRYSGLSEINPGNLAGLRAEWVFHARNTSRLEATPVVVNGMMLVTAANDAFALDARTGRVVWHHSWPLSEGLIDDAAGHINRGVAVWRDRVYMETDNAHLLCLDVRSGNLIWDVAYADWNRNYGATSAPLVVKDKVLVGTSGGDDGVRGFVAAYDALTGKLAWRFWTIPGPGEFGSESWPGKLYLHGGGTTWMPGTYDPQLNTIYWGTSNPAPDFQGDVRPGDDLYTDCVLALDPDTGKLKWYFQFTPHDLFDYDAVETPVLIDIDFRGAPRKLLVEANRNGYIYVLDRTNGRVSFGDAVRGKTKLGEGNRCARQAYSYRHGPDQGECSVDRDPNQAEGQQQQPHERIEDQRQQCHRPAQHEEQAPEQEGDHKETSS